MRKTAFFIFVVLLASLLVAACDAQNGTDASPSSSELVSATTTPATPPPQGTPGIASPITTTMPSSEVTIWIPSEVPGFVDEGSAYFNDQLLAYEASHPDVILTVEQKPVGGQGGMLSYLRSARNVAPSILPDLIALPTADLASVAEESLIYPLDDIVDPALYDDLFPVSIALVRSNGQSIGFPFLLNDFHHMVYHSDAITDTLSLSWPTLISEGEHDFVFPAAGQSGAVLALMFYLDSGGEVITETGQPVLELDPLTRALEWLSLGRAENFIDLQSSNITNLEENWQYFEGGTANLAQISADIFLRHRSSELAIGFAPLPGPEGALPALANGWAWAITAAEAEQRTLASELLFVLVSEPGLGEWSLRAGFLPARREAFRAWPQEDPYVLFLQQELEKAQAFPAVTTTLLPAIGDAVFDVTSLSASAQGAAAAATAAVGP